MPTFDGDNLIITLDSGITSVDIKDVYEGWKDWMLTSTLNRRYPYALRSDGGAALSSIINQGSYFFLNNSAGWRIKPPEENITIYLTGNLAVEDTDLPAFIPTTGAYTAAILGLQPVTQGVTEVMGSQLSYASFENRVTIDVLNGESGTGNNDAGEPIGTRKYPSNNLTDTKLIAAREGFDGIYVLGDLIIDNSDTFIDYVFFGQGHHKSDLDLDMDATISGCEFKHATVHGYLDGNCTIYDAHITNLNYVTGHIEKCVLEEGTMTLASLASANILDSWGGDSGANAPVIDCGGTGQIFLSNYSGDVIIKNHTGTQESQIIMNGGTVTLDSTCTSGTIIVDGTGLLVDNSSGSAVDDEGLVSGADINYIESMLSNIEGGLTHQEAMRVMLAAMAGLVSGADSNAPVFRDVYNTKNRITAVTDEHGNRTSVSLNVS